MNKFGENLRKIRTEKKYSLENVSIQLACKGISVSKHGLSAYELGKSEPNIDTLIALAELFNVTVDSLLGKDEHSTPLPTTTEKFVKILSNETNGLFDELVSLPKFHILLSQFMLYKNMSFDFIESYARNTNPDFYSNVLKIKGCESNIKQDIMYPLFRKALLNVLDDIDNLTQIQLLNEVEKDLTEEVGHDDAIKIRKIMENKKKIIETKINET